MPGLTRIDALRQIVTERTAAKVEGTLVDLYTASAMVAVYDALSPANQAKFGDIPLLKLAEFAYKATS